MIFNQGELLNYRIMRNFFGGVLVIACMANVYSQDSKATEVWSPEPPVVTPGANGSAPSDAIVLFDGKNLASWAGEDGKEAKWSIADGAMTIVPGSGGIKTNQTFGDIQLHIEWRTPAK